MKISAETLYLRKYLGDRETIRVLAEAGFDCIDYTMDHMVKYIMNLGITFADTL